MVGPIDGVLAIHNAFRADMAAIDAAAVAAARGTGGLEATVERFRFFDEILTYHAEGEENAVFPILDEVAPLVAEAYAIDHRRLDDAFDTLSNAVSAHDALQTARATAAFKFHLDTHLAKEDAHLFRIIRSASRCPTRSKPSAPCPQPCRATASRSSPRGYIHCSTTTTARTSPAPYRCSCRGRSSLQPSRSSTKRPVTASRS